jgi:hypothetical protein
MWTRTWLSNKNILAFEVSKNGPYYVVPVFGVLKRTSQRIANKVVILTSAQRLNVYQETHST